jgi:hypothetical protein
MMCTRLDQIEVTDMASSMSSVFVTTYYSIQQSRHKASGVHWDPLNENNRGLGANIMTLAEDLVWESTMKTKVCYR